MTNKRFCMSPVVFETLLGLAGPTITKKTVKRDPVSTREIDINIEIFKQQEIIYRQQEQGPTESALKRLVV